MKRLYIAGPYSADNIIDILDNIRIGMRAGTKALLDGVAPFVPWLDYHFNLMLQDNEKLTVNDFYQYSLAWLEVSDALYVLPNYENSKGTLAEIEFARQHNIPVFFSYNDAIEYLSKLI